MALPKETTIIRSRRGTGAAARRDGRRCPAAAMVSGNASLILSLEICPALLDSLSLMRLCVCVRLLPRRLCLDVRRCDLFIGWVDGPLWV
jgi:hypothetical protein